MGYSSLPCLLAVNAGRVCPVREFLSLSAIRNQQPAEPEIWDSVQMLCSISQGSRAHSNFGRAPAAEQPRGDRPENETPHMSGVSHPATGGLL